MRLPILALSVVLTFPALAQDAPTVAERLAPGHFSLQYNSVLNGRGLSATYHQPMGDRGWRMYGGLRYHIHRPKSDLAPQGIYPKALYARNIGEHIGLKMGVEKGYPIFKDYPTELYGFFDVQISRGALQASPYELYDSASRAIITDFGTPRGDILYWENSFGLGLRSQVSDRFGYRIFGGGTVAAIHEQNTGIIGDGLFGNWTDQLWWIVGVGVDVGLR
jgi:hypothetical protein